MTQEEILSQIKSQLGNTAVSDRTITRLIASHPLAEGTDPDETYLSNIVADCKEFEGNINFIVASRVNEQVNAKIEEFKKKFNPQPPTPPTPPTSKDDETKTMIEKMQQQILDMQKANEANQRKSEIAAMRSRVSLRGKELNVANDALWKDSVNAVSVGDEMTEDALLSESKKLYEEKLKLYVGEGAKPYQSNSNPFQGLSKDSAVADYFKAKAKREGWAKQ